MHNNESKPETFDEQQSIQVIREMIQVSQKKLKNDGILFILWGWVMFCVYVGSYILSRIVLSHSLRNVLNYSGYLLGILALAFTVYYILKHQKRVQTYIGISLRYVWISMAVGLILVNLIQFNVLHKIIFELQQPIFMVLIAFATVITGGILRYNMIIIGGIIFGILAYGCSFMSLQNQMLVEALAWIIAFIIPGHILYAKRDK